jgi:hypothetical protein
MPTKINKSPLTLDPVTAISLAIKGAAGGASASKEYADKVRQDLGIEEGRKGLLKSDEFKDLSFGKKLGIFGKGLGYNVVGHIEGMTGVDLLPEAKEPEKPTYSTNIDPMTGEEILPNQDLVNKYGIPMTGKPLKMLTGIKGNIPRNMSAKQHNDALKMQEISGASSLMFTEEGLNKLPNDIPGKFGDIVRKEKTEQKNK